MATPEVSVILPTRDRAHLLAAAARSVLDQDEVDLELIIIDDASQDNVEAVVERLHDSRVRFWRSPARIGPAAARNAALSRARGQWIAFQDDDDLWLPGKLRRQLAIARSVPDSVAAVYCGFWKHEAGRRRYVPGARITRVEGDLLAALLRGNFIGLPTLLVRHSALLSIGPFDTGLPCYEDWELCLRLARQFRFRCIDAPLVVAQDSPGSVNKTSAARKAAALQRMLEVHDEVIQRDPGIAGVFLRRLGHQLCLSGEMRAGRTYLARSFRRSAGYGAALGLLAACGGASAYRRFALAFDRARNAAPEERPSRPRTADDAAGDAAADPATTSSYHDT